MFLFHICVGKISQEQDKFFIKLVESLLIFGVQNDQMIFKNKTKLSFNKWAKMCGSRDWSPNIFWSYHKILWNKLTIRNQLCLLAKSLLSHSVDLIKTLEQNLLDLQ